MCLSMDNQNGWKQHLMTPGRWLTPGLGLKRWLVVLGVGAVVTGMGFVFLVESARSAGWLPMSLTSVLTLQFLPAGWRAAVPIIIGGVLMVVAVVRLGANLIQPFRRPGEDVAESLYLYSRRSRGPRIVAIGGGTGLPTLLRGLKAHTSNITAIVTVADDGGSSGRLRRDFGLLPPGDFRNNMAALASDEALMTQLFQYRFGGAGVNGKTELQGHAFGNLLLAALAGITGSFDEALLAAARVLAMRGRVMPSTLDQVHLVAEVAVETEGGGTVVQRIQGESAIPEARGVVQKVYLEPAGVRAYPQAVKAILQADLIILGPGSLYTSILPNLLVRDLAEAVRSARAPKVYVCNLAMQPGETDNYHLADHVLALEKHCRGCIDVVLGNDNLSVPPETGGGHTVFVEPIWPAGQLEGVRLVKADLVDESRPWRHDSEKLARVIVELLEGAR